MHAMHIMHTYMQYLQRIYSRDAHGLPLLISSFSYYAKVTANNDLEPEQIYEHSERIPFCHLLKLSVIKGELVH